MTHLITRRGQCPEAAYWSFALISSYLLDVFNNSCGVARGGGQGAMARQSPKKIRMIGNGGPLTRR